MIRFCWKHVVLGLAAALVASPAMAGSVKGNHKGHDLPSFYDEGKKDHDVNKHDEKSDKKDEKDFKPSHHGPKFKLIDILDHVEKELKHGKKQDHDDRFDVKRLFKDWDCDHEHDDCEEPPRDDKPDCHAVPLPPAAWTGLLTLGGAAWGMGRKRLGLA